VGFRLCLKAFAAQAKGVDCEHRGWIAARMHPGFDDHLASMPTVSLFKDRIDIASTRTSC